MKLFYTDEFVLPLPSTHAFPMAKYSLLRQRLQADPRVHPDWFTRPPAATWAELATTHAEAYLQRLFDNDLTNNEVRRLGFPWSPQLLERSRRSVGATIAASRHALEHGVAVNLAGGTHHAFFDRPEAYCVFNDAVVAARLLLQEGRVQTVWIIDVDAHQGNGTAALTRPWPQIVSFSLHSAKSFPSIKQVSDLDIALPPETGDALYLSALHAGLLALRHGFPKPQLAIYLAGADPFEKDRLGRLSLTKAGLRERDRIALSSLHNWQIPVAIAMAGGYAHDVTDIVDIHAATVLTAIEVFGYLS